MRHGRAALLAGAEKFFGLQHFGALHVADFNGNILDPAGDHPKGCEIHRVAVARDNLGADGFGGQAQFAADILFNRRINIGECANRTRNRPRRHFGPCRQQPRVIACHFGVKPREHQSHRGGFGMNAVAAPDADRKFMLIRAGLQCRHHPVKARQQQISGPHKLHIQSGVQHVGTGHALMHKPRLIGADDIGQMGQKGDDIMFGYRLDPVNFGHIKRHIAGFPHRFGIGARDHPQICHRITGMRLNFKPDPEFGFGRPQSHHFGAGVTRDHGVAFQ